MRREVLAIALDAGGTMTDTFVLDKEGNFVIGKASTTPWDESEGFMESAEDAIIQWELSLRDAFNQLTVCVYTGTTMLNTLLQRKGKKVGLIITKGLEDILLMEQGRQVWSGYSYADRLHAVTHVHNKPLIPRRRIRGVSERVDMFGKVVIPIYEHDAYAAVEELCNEGVEAIIICFIFSHVNPSHEERMEQIVREVLTVKNLNIPIFSSANIRPIVRENQRLNATMIEAYAAAPVRDQLRFIEQKVQNAGFKHSLMTLLSYGGLANVSYPRLHETLVSGPIGGILGAQFICETIGLKNALCTDMGGTSFDFGLISNGQISLCNELELARFRLNLPSITLDSVSGGAGSYIKIDPISKRLEIGPESAGGNPGPVAYDRGNNIPTVVDCLVINGYINPDYYLGGKVKLDVVKAKDSLERQVARPLGLDVHVASEGVIKLWLQNALEAVKRALQSKGYDAADYYLMSYGGAGPLALSGCTEGHPFKGILTFPFAAAFSAFGCTTADYSHRYTRSTFLMLAQNADKMSKEHIGSEITKGLLQLKGQALNDFQREGMGVDEISYTPIVFVRYTGQLDDVEVRVSSIESNVDKLIDLFEDLYSKTYVKAAKYPEAGYSIMQIALVASIRTVKPKFPSFPLSCEEPPSQSFKGDRHVFSNGEWKTAKTFEMDLLLPGNKINGLAIIEHPATTLIVPENRNIWVDEHKFIWMNTSNK